MRFLAFLFLVAHGLVHAVMWSLPFSEEATADLPMDPTHSWLVGDSRTWSFALAMATTGAFIVAAFAYLAGAGWWPAGVALAAGLSVVLMGVFFSPWWLVGFLIDAVILVAAWRAATDG